VPQWKTSYYYPQPKPTSYHTKPTQKVIIIMIIMPGIFTDFNKTMNSAAQPYREIENITRGEIKQLYLPNQTKRKPEVA